MGTITTEAQKLVWNAKSTFENLTSGAQDLFSSVVGRASAAASSILNGDVVGINGEEIPNMQAAIREYVNGLESHLNEVKQDADTSQAFKGEYAAAVKQFVEAVCDACDAIISNLLQFNQKLDEVYAKYQAKDTTMAADISGQAGELSASYTKYTE